MSALDPQGLAGSYLIRYLVNVDPDLKARRVVDLISVRAVNQAPVCLNAIVDLNIRCISKLVFLRKAAADLFRMVPVIVAVKLKAVTPNVEKPRDAPCVICALGNIDRKKLLVRLVEFACTVKYLF